MHDERSNTGGAGACGTDYALIDLYQNNLYWPEPNANLFGIDVSYSNFNKMERLLEENPIKR